MPKPKEAKQKKTLVGKAPLGSLPADKGISAVSAKTDYSIGDVVFWGTPTTAGEYTFIGHPKGDTAGKVLVLAHSGEVGQVLARFCRACSINDIFGSRVHQGVHVIAPSLEPAFRRGIRAGRRSLPRRQVGAQCTARQPILYDTSEGRLRG
jgi:hypothetical protein